MNSLPYLLVFTFIGSVAGLIGGVILLFKERWAKALASISVPLAAGVLLSISLLDLLPEAVEESGDIAYSIILIVFVVFFLIENFLFYLHHHSDTRGGESHHGHSAKSIPLVILGDTIHNFLDGVAISASFIINPSLGLFVALSTFLHETPHEIADFGILINKGWTRKNAFLANFFSSLATFPGAILTYYFASKAESLIGILLAVSAGLFLYIASTDFIPEIEHAFNKNIKKQALFLILGICSVILIRVLIPEIGH
ncbi:hypothetical protein A2714_02180 [Candidatus Woesebacteria bacterium RIFCSPHIGHO2_01_FULL_38_9]|uniref:ZIP zinc transporter n=2 Tax=Candidatus Woeseibacteriota TaxID=1752722 RepID=A0A1F7Y315_9BACT|nr:MAG: hypothetical protein A2714_02180 [Candidatus Woesebacteria bacterium RIFCSPHIGHO2_01_FULL_38_9]OGM60370.1 MAG: hypothetical protein A3A75_03940 [Candidatus Woesebacteria bacterium RIFCSPLOWO2_01_FULL_39_10]